MADPTLLLSVDEWNRIVKKPDAVLPERYLLTYFLGGASDERILEIERLAAEHDCQIIHCMDEDSPFFNIGPDEFLYLIRHAQIVCTNSFHGSIFSILWRRPLAIFTRTDDHSNTGSRIQTLVRKLHIESHLASGDRTPDYDDMCDYALIWDALATEQKQADLFLKNVFAHVPEVMA